jgi:hypothetical protein
VRVSNDTVRDRKRFSGSTGSLPESLLRAFTSENRRRDAGATGCGKAGCKLW